MLGYASLAARESMPGSHAASTATDAGAASLTPVPFSFQLSPPVSQAFLTYKPRVHPGGRLRG